MKQDYNEYMNSDTHLVCVYGTLKRGQCNNYLLGRSTFLGESFTRPEYTMYDIGCPYISHGGKTSIKIEVYEVNDYTMSLLDRLEGYPHFYNRTEIETEFGPAWIYYIDTKNTDDLYMRGYLVESGEW